MAVAGVLPTPAAWRQLKSEMAELRRQHRNLTRRLNREAKRGQRPAGMESRWYVCKANEQIAQGGSGAVTVWAGPSGSETETSRVITGCFNRTEITVESGTWCRVMILGPRRKYVEPWECP